MSKTVLLCAFILSVLLSCSVLAVEVKDLYRAKWPVAEQSKSARWKAALAGFKEVLVRKSGSKAILKTDLVQQSYRKVTSYLQRFTYTRTEDMDQEYPYSISLYFEPRLIDSLIQDSQMPLWGANRPVTMLWLASEEGVTRQLVTAQQVDQEIVEAIETYSLRRGVPVILPLMDLEDELVVSTSDVWGRFSAPILDASQRYSADTVVFGRISRQSQSWLGVFSFVNQNKEFRFEIESQDKVSLVEQLINRLADKLCEQYCVVEETGQKNEIIMDVVNVTNFEQYKSLENYLNQMSSIRSIKLQSISNDRLVIKLTLLGQIESVAEGISLSQRLIPITPPNDKSLENQNTQFDPAVQDEITPDELKQNPSKLDSEDNELPQSGSHSDIVEPIIVPQKRFFYRWIG